MRPTRKRKRFLPSSRSPPRPNQRHNTTKCSHRGQEQPRPYRRPFQTTKQQQRQFPTHLQMHRPTLHQRRILGPPKPTLFCQQCKSLPDPAPNLQRNVSISKQPLQQHRYTTLNSRDNTKQEEVCQQNHPRHLNPIQDTNKKEQPLP